MAEAEAQTKQPITDEIATTAKDLDLFAGWLRRLENPDPVLRTEAGGKGLRLYDEVDRDSHAGAVLQTRRLAVTGKPWSVQPAGKTARAKAIAEAVEAAFNGCNFNQFCQEILKAALYGFYGAEVMWQATGGRWVPKKLRAKHPRRFSFDLEREPRLLTPENMIDGEALPPRKFIIFTFGSSDNPYGEGLGQKLWWSVWFKKHGIKFWLVFLEKFGMPTAVGKYPPGTEPKQQQALLDAIDAIQNETGVKIPNTMAIDLLEASRTGTATHQPLCEYMDRQMSKAVLGQTATTEGTPGKLGNDDVQGDVRQDILEADASLLCECLNETLVRWIVDFNFWGVTDYPTLRIQTEDEEDSGALAERDKNLAAVGVKFRAPYFKTAYGLAEDDFDLADGVGGEAVGGSFAESADLSPAATLGAITDRAMESDAMAGMVAPIEKLLGEVTSLEEYRDRLIDLYPDLDDQALGNVLQQAMAVADLSGRFDGSGKTA